MYDSAKVLSVYKDGSVLVLPLIKNACINCTEGSCAKRGSPFTVINPAAFALEPGMKVYIRAHKGKQALQALVALCIPIICAVIGWFSANKYAALHMKDVPHEWVQAAGVLAGIFIPAAVIGLISKKMRPACGEIIGIEE
ncbi:SoxR reducing system RseC family protein [Treponema sp. HNW]|uniref:SoxR reducing system RseC family protein n=1 Tax=Treponema sp. HNW TaxID=3116654 RepID=UPI003D0DE190